MNTPISNIINDLNIASDSGDSYYLIEVIASNISNLIVDNLKSYLIILEKSGHKFINISAIGLTDAFINNLNDKKFTNTLGYYLARKKTKDKVKIKSFVKKFSNSLCKIDKDKEKKEYLRELLLLWTVNSISLKEKKFDFTGNSRIRSYIYLIGVSAILISIYIIKKEKINSFFKKIIV